MDTKVTSSNIYGHIRVQQRPLYNQYLSHSPLNQSQIPFPIGELNLALVGGDLYKY